VTQEIRWLAVLPELVLALGAAAVLLIEVQWKPRRAVLGAAAAVSLALAAACALAQWVAAQEAPAAARVGELTEFSGMVLMDGFAVFARLTLLAVTGLGLAAGWRLMEDLGRRGAEAIALVLLAATGFSIMVAANNLVMMFLGLEVGSIALYVLAGATRERAEPDEAALKYFLLGAFASAIFAYGAALLYAGTGWLEVLAIRGFFEAFVVTSPAVIYAGLALVIVGLAFKVSAAPFHSWAPDVYQGAPAGVVGYMAATAKIAGFAALARILLTGLPRLDDRWLPVVAGVSALSMVLGSTLALVQRDVRRMLAYSGVASAGFIMTGVVGGGTAPLLFYVAVYTVQLVGAFAVVAAVGGSTASGAPLEEYGGLASKSPGLAASFVVLLLGMAGLPLTSGFAAKFAVFARAWAAGYEWLVVVALLTSVVVFAAYLRVVVAMYMDEAAGGDIDAAPSAKAALAVAVTATVAWGVAPGSLLDIAADAFPL